MKLKGLKKLTASRLVCDLSQLLCTLVATVLSLFEHLTSSISHHATSAHNFKTLKESCFDIAPISHHLFVKKCVLERKENYDVVKERLFT